MKKILIVEDSVVSLNHFKAALAPHFELKIALNIKEARSKIGNNFFDLVLLDINLPDGNGFDFYTELISMGHGSCPVVFVSTETSKENILRGLELGQCDFIFKPFNPDELLVRVETQIAIRERCIKNLKSEKDFITGNFGHEINNPLMCILNAYTAIKKLYPLENTKHDIMMEKNIARLTDITKHYVEFYKDHEKDEYSVKS